MRKHVVFDSLNAPIKHDLVIEAKPIQLLVIQTVTLPFENYQQVGFGVVMIVMVVLLEDVGRVHINIDIHSDSL